MTRDKDKPEMAGNIIKITPKHSDEIFYNSFPSDSPRSLRNHSPYFIPNQKEKGDIFIDKESLDRPFPELEEAVKNFHARMQTQRRALLNLGYILAGGDIPEKFLDSYKRALESEDYEVAVLDPYSFVLIPSQWRRDDALHTVEVYVRKISPKEE